MQRQAAEKHNMQNSHQSWVYAPTEVTPDNLSALVREASWNAKGRVRNLGAPQATLLAEIKNYPPLCNKQSQIDNHDAMTAYNDADSSRAQVTPTYPSSTYSLGIIDAPLWALFLGAAGMAIASLLIGFGLGMAIVVDLMVLFSNAALVLSYVTVSLSVAASGVYFWCWHG